MGAEARLVEIGIELPPVFAPVGSYLGCKRSGDLLYVGGHGPVTPHGVTRGKLGATVVDEVVDYEGIYRLCYIRGPEGILIGLAQELGHRTSRANPLEHQG